MNRLLVAALVAPFLFPGTAIAKTSIVGTWSCTLKSTAALTYAVTYHSDGTIDTFVNGQSLVHEGEYHVDGATRSETVTGSGVWTKYRMTFHGANAFEDSSQTCRRQ